jgi:hypothetical protein
VICTHCRDIREKGSEIWERKGRGQTCKRGKKEDACGICTHCRDLREERERDLGEERERDMREERERIT